MKPINRKWLQAVITLYNAYKDPDTGNTSHYHTFLRYVRIDQKKKGLIIANQGGTATFYSMIYIDPKSSHGYFYDDLGVKNGKKYLAAQEWQNLPENQKHLYWTLQVKDMVVEGECPGRLIEPAEDSFKDTFKPWIISEIPPSIAKDGSVHHWEVILD